MKIKFYFYLYSEKLYMRTLRLNTICALLLMVVTPNSHASLLTIDFGQVPMSGRQFMTSTILWAPRSGLRLMTRQIIDQILKYSIRARLQRPSFDIELVDGRQEVTNAVWYCESGNIDIPTISTWRYNTKSYTITSGYENSDWDFNGNWSSFSSQTTYYYCEESERDSGVFDRYNDSITTQEHRDNPDRWASDYYDYLVSFETSVTPVPLPATVWLFIPGIIMIVGVSRRKKNTLSIKRLTTSRPESFN